MACPKVISHRGANKYAPQNTIPAFKKSLELGIDGFETDVHLTKDGVPVLCHNYTIDETSNSHGKICEKTLSELKQYDFGAYFSPKFKGTEIPTLDEFLSLVETSDISVLNIELKNPEQGETSIVKDTLDLVKKHNLFDRLIISSFNPKLLVEAKELDEKCKTGYLYSPNQKITYTNKMLTHPVQFAKSIGADALHPMSLYVTKKYVYNAHEAGLLVNPWTVDSAKSIEKMIGCEVDGIITDYPDVVNGLIDKHF